MHIILRQETSADYDQVFDLVKKAFANLEISDKTEQFLVERLRKSDAFFPELSIVAEFENKVVGYILLTKLKI
jgi:predicted N-acetyltransferase YhbS